MRRFALILALTLASCRNLPDDLAQDVREARNGAGSIMHAVETGQAAPLDSRSMRAVVATYDYSWAILYAFDEEDELPDDVRARQERRRELRVQAKQRAEAGQ